LVELLRLGAFGALRARHRTLIDFQAQSVCSGRCRNKNRLTARAFAI
jgi:hypothetical protein